MQKVNHHFTVMARGFFSKLDDRRMEASMYSDPRDSAAARDRDAARDAAPSDNADAVRTAIADSVSELSRSTDPQHIVAKALALIGTATGASRIRLDSRASLNKPPQRYEWHAPTSAAPPEDAAAKLAQKPPFVIPGVQLTFAPTAC
jgi:hypothetical protein